MKQIKQFKSTKELNAVIKILKESGIEHETEGTVLYVSAGDIIKTRDIILDVARGK